MTNDKEIADQSAVSKNRPGGHDSSLVIGHWSLVIFLYALDQLTKWLVFTNFEPYSSRPVIPRFFDLVYVMNTGAAFGSFRGGNTFFIALSAVALIVLFALQWRGAFRCGWTRTGVALLMAGILGNLTDRLWHRHVIDFLSFDLHVPFANPWPSFNVADSCICVAVALFMISSIREEWGGAARKKQ